MFTIQYQINLIRLLFRNDFQFIYLFIHDVCFIMFYLIVLVLISLALGTWLFYRLVIGASF